MKQGVIIKSRLYKACWLTFLEARYVKTRRVGEGTFAVVYEALDTAQEPPVRVALKKIKLIKQEGNAPNGLDISAVRELKALRHLSENDCHPNIAPLLDVWLPSLSNKTVGNLHLVLPFYDFDLEALIKDSRIVFSPADIKAWMWMMLSGIEYCHERDIIHRVKRSFRAFYFNFFFLFLGFETWKFIN